MPAQLNIVNEDNGWKVEMISRSGESLMSGEWQGSYALVEKARLAFASNVCRYEHYRPFLDLEGSCSFHLVDNNGLILASGKKYWSENSRDYAMMMAKKECMDIALS